MKFDIVIQCNTPITKSQRKAVHEELRSALERDKANQFFANLVKNAVTHSVEESEPIVKTVDTLKKEKDLYAFYFKKASKQDKDRITIGFTPNSTLPSAFIHTEMVENFLYEVTIVEVSHIINVKSIKAKYNK